MSLVSLVLHNIIDTIRVLSIDAFNTKTTTILYTDVPCRWERKTNIITDKDAIPKIATIEVWLLPEYEIDFNYEFVKDGEVYKIMGIDERHNLNGILDHRKVYLA